MLGNLRYVLVGVGVSLVVALIAGLVLSPTWRIELTAAVEASPEAVHRFVGHFEEWGRWAQWTEAEDPAVTLDSTIEDGQPVQRVIVRNEERARLVMDSSDPGGVQVSISGTVSGTQTIRYERIDDHRTRITWTDEGRVNVPILGGLMALDVQSRLNEHHESALRKLKALAESVD